MTTALTVYASFCYGAAALWSAYYIGPDWEETTWPDLARIAAVVAMAPITVPSAVLFLLVLARIDFDQPEQN